jgi:hypothetical protein
MLPGADFEITYYSMNRNAVEGGGFGVIASMQISATFERNGKQLERVGVVQEQHKRHRR